jgi:glyoxylase-like metal-dependent hydrolase (beta-lactamase superfamily II)
MTEAIRAIDVRHRGRERVICVWLVDDVLVDCGPSACVETLLAGLGERRPRALALTHIHLDHAGAAGTLVERFPDLEVWVHERGAPHLVDPTRLLASASRLYGDKMERLWGEFRAVPEENMRVLRGGEQLGAIEVAYTPGHASHHVSYWHAPTRTAFVGDVAGVRIHPSSYILAPTPPPDIDVEAWEASIELVRAWRPERLAITHFGLFDDVDSHLDGISRALAASAERARDGTVEEFIATTTAEIAGAGDADTIAGYNMGAPLDQTYVGLARYWSKREALR